MKQRVAIALAAITVSGVATAQDETKFQCTLGDMQRRVEIVTEPGVEVPCSVHYYKDTEAPGEQQALWTAQNDASYCSSKARELVSKLQGWGWDCGHSEDGTSDDDFADEIIVDDDEEMLGIEEPPE